jgi:hypothetical protein
MSKRVWIIIYIVFAITLCSGLIVNETIVIPLSGLIIISLSIFDYFFIKHKIENNKYYKIGIKSEFPGIRFFQIFCGVGWIVIGLMTDFTIAWYQIDLMVLIGLITFFGGIFNNRNFKILIKPKTIVLSIFHKEEEWNYKI